MRMTCTLRPAATVGKRRPLRTLSLVVAAAPAALAAAIAADVEGTKALSVVPAEGRVASTFGPRKHPVTGKSVNHRGIDIAAPTSTPVRAAGAGRVVQVGEQGAYGLTIVHDHGDGLITRYAQLDGVDVR